MFTSLDKALAAGLGSIAFLGTYFFGTDLGLTPEAINGTVAVIGTLLPVIVYWVPNLKAGR